jgi:VIT1/CCC1 family predicted Fe2+/Mn2+ transporter
MTGISEAENTSETIKGVREAVGFFDTEKSLQEAIDDLLSQGFDRAEISVLASVEAIEDKMRGVFDKVSHLEDNAETPRVAYIAKEDIGDAKGAVIGGFLYVGAMIGLVPIVISGGALAAVLTAAAIGGGVGTAIGSILSRSIDHHHSDYISEQLQHGGLLLWVRTFTLDDERRAVKILSKHSAHDVHVHGLPDVQTELDDAYLGRLQNAQDGLYNGAHIVRSDRGAYYTSGKIFSGEDEAKAYIDRVAQINARYESSCPANLTLKEAMIDPPDVYETVSELVDSTLSKRTKMELLHRWAYNEKELEMASDDGMTNSFNGDKLQEIENAIAALEAE